MFAGIDDATKCPCIGSIYVAGVVADKAGLLTWKRAGVKDSKLLNRSLRDQLDRMIRRTAAAYSILHLPPSQIDDKSFNLNTWEMIAVLKLVQNLYRLQPFVRVRIDNFEVSEERFFQRFEDVMHRSRAARLRAKSIRLRKKLLRRIQLLPEHRADEEYTIVGAASILARAASDWQYDRFRKLYGDFGSGSPGDPKTRRFVWTHRKAPPPIIRTSWNTFRTLRDLDRIEDDQWYKHNSIKENELATDNQDKSGTL